MGTTHTGRHYDNPYETWVPHAKNVKANIGNIIQGLVSGAGDSFNQVVARGPTDVWDPFRSSVTERREKEKSSDLLTEDVMKEIKRMLGGGRV
jgi:hypothetical protein